MTNSEIESIENHDACADQCGTEYDAHKGGYKITVRVKVPKASRQLDSILELAQAAGGHIGGIVPQTPEEGFKIHDIMLIVKDSSHGEELVEQIKKLSDVQVVAASDRTFLMHLGGKITVSPKRPIRNLDDLSMIYTPGVARVCKAISLDPSKARTLTIKGNTVAVFTDGSRILALGNIGPEAGLPVMEGKAALFKRFGDVDAFPIAVDGNIDPLINVIKHFYPQFDASAKDVQEKLRAELLIMVARAVAPNFGAINLEDIASPRCYEVEDRLHKELPIPVMHDDQHGTAIVVAAATKNAAKLTRKRLATMKVVVCGVGAAGMACAEMILALGVKNLIGYNVNGPLHKGRTDLTPQERWLADHSNPRNFTGTIEEALKGADMFLGLSAAGAIKAEWLSKMKKNAICFALANPVPEVLPKDAKPYVAVMATGGSNYPNQINNALVFPGVFRGALDSQISDITYEMQLEAAHALAAVVTKDELDFDKIIPSVFEQKAHDAVAEAIRRVAKRNSVGRFKVDANKK
ncbi:MAG TPA: NADP-dependent malic enzyme [Planktothrix sp.]